MDDQALAMKLASLAQADMDAAALYEQASAQITEPVIGERLGRYRQDHLGHFRELAAYIADLGAAVPEARPSRQEYVPGAGGPPGQAPDTEAVLRVLYALEMENRQAYRDAAGWDLPLKARGMVDGGCGDEQHHLAFLEEAMKDVSRGKTAGGGKGEV